MTRPFIRLVIAAAFLLMIGLSARADDLKSMEGKWKVESAEVEGKAADAPELKDLFINIIGERYEVATKEGAERGSLKLDESQKPKTLDATRTEGSEAGKVIKAIYELKGDTMRVCYAMTGDTRPTEFATKAGSPLLLITYRRQKD